MHLLLKKIDRITWQPVFSREGFPYFIARFSMEGYVLDMAKRIGIGYRDTLVVAKGDLLTSYESTRDARRFERHLATASSDFFISANRQIQQALRETSQVVRRIDAKLTHPKTAREQLPTLVTDLYRAYRHIYGVYRFPTIVDSHARQHVRPSILARLARTKDRCGHFFALVDRTTLHRIQKLISLRLQLDSELVWCMDYQELIASLRQNRPAVSLEVLRKRKAGYVLFSTGRAFYVSAGPAARKMQRRLHFINYEISSDQSVQGMPAYSGRAVGTVRVIRSVAELKQRRAGDILVTPMTTVHFAPYLKRFSAFITDEGGLTCHAAIIARELKKPCIIGTKIATKVFKDGDRVEVDATKGVVRKI